MLPVMKYLHFYSCPSRASKWAPLECKLQASSVGPASWSSGQSFGLLIMRSRDRFPALPWGFFLEGEDSHADHGLGSSVELRLRPLLVLHIHISPSTSSGQRNCASWVEVGYNAVTTGREDQEVHKGHVVGEKYH
jgi:hypothetical protein